MFPILGHDIPRGGKSSRLIVECHTGWGLGCLALPREELWEGDVELCAGKKKRCSFWSTYDVASTVLSALHASLDRIHTTTYVIYPIL